METEFTTRIFVEIRRGLVHTTIGTCIGVSGLLLPEVLFFSLLGAGTIFFLLLEFLRFKSAALNRRFLSFFKLVLRESEDRRLSGASYLLLGALLTFLIFERDIAAMSVFFLALGDPIAVIMSGNSRIRKIGKNSIQGNLVCLVGCILVGLLLYFVGLNITLPSVFVGAITATIIGTLPLNINDNLTIPLGSGLVITLVQLMS